KEEFPEIDLPIRLDEIGVHPLLDMAFEHAGAGSLAGTRWKVAWQAEMLAFLLEERIAQAGPWLVSYDAPAYFASLALTYAAGGIDYRIASDARLIVDGEREGEGEGVSVHVAARDAERVGYAWSRRRADGGLRIAVWQFPRFATTDGRLAEDPTR